MSSPSPVKPTLKRHCKFWLITNWGLLLLRILIKLERSWLGRASTDRSCNSLFTHHFHRWTHPKVKVAHWAKATMECWEASDKWTTNISSNKLSREIRCLRNQCSRDITNLPRSRFNLIRAWSRWTFLFKSLCSTPMLQTPLSSTLKELSTKTNSKLIR